MLNLTSKAGVAPAATAKSHPVYACLGAAALAATMLFTLNGLTEASAADDPVQLPAIQAVTDVSHGESAEDHAALRQARVAAASRSDVRNLSEAPVAVTPAPIWCSFTGLTHLAETHELCSHPSNNGPEQNRALGEYLAAERGWTGNQWQCLDNLMTRESRWRHTAANPVSTARGIPQKMMSVHYGANWRTSSTASAWLNDPEAQIEWGLNYIARRYSTPCGAWNFFQRNGWY